MDLHICFYQHSYDYLRITNENNQIFGTFCGNKSGHVVIVTGYYARLTFHSDSSVNDIGYKLFFSDFSQGKFLLLNSKEKRDNSPVKKKKKEEISTVRTVLLKKIRQIRTDYTNHILPT